MTDYLTITDLRRLSEIDRRLDQNTEQRQTLTTIMARDYLEPTLFTQESKDNIVFTLTSRMEMKA